MTNLQALKTLSQEKKVLFVDDDLEICTKMAQFLSKLFAHVDLAHDGEAALTLYKAAPYHIVITDISMPKMDGLALAKAVRALDEEQEILIVSAFSDYHYLSGSIAIGVSGYLLKPFDFEVLTQELYKSLVRVEMRRENRAYKEGLERMVDQKSHDLELLQQRRIEEYEMTLRSMVEMIESRDTYTAGHSVRVAEYSVKIAQTMGYDEPTCALLYKAGILHDIGKIAIPDNILLNPQRLEPLEQQIIREHVAIGYRLLHNIPIFAPIAEIMRHHHERYDGTGYPDALSGNAIDPLARIMIVADAFDAMTTSRIYKARKELPEALSELRTFSGVQFHPEVVDAAVVALQQIQLNAQVDQLPHNQLEQERFAYFYRDPLTGFYNKRYLDVILKQNVFSPEPYRYMHLILLHRFSQFNKSHGWEAGDALLKSFSLELKALWPEAMIFRVFGDNFVILDRETLNLERLDAQSQKLSDQGITLSYRPIDLQLQPLANIAQIKGF
ncbi:MAG: response regulator [Campylobacterales bacterium]|nr:response regulator [Campylobacterales bacterium]